MRGVNQHDAQYRAVEPDLVEHLRDIDVDGQVRHRLRQQEHEQNRPAPWQLESCQRITGRYRHGEAEGDGQHRNPHARPQRGQRVAARLEHAVPVGQTEFQRQLVGKIPALGERPQQ